MNVPQLGNCSQGDVAETFGQQSTFLSHITSATVSRRDHDGSFQSHVAKFEELPGIDD